jgi:dolichyl-diphosphooligosaccharide--protein glycosyltransferase/undecaprenyl-diphosphooligosaccharide--protein glycosyltransferase
MSAVACEPAAPGGAAGGRSPAVRWLVAGALLLVAFGLLVRLLPPFLANDVGFYRFEGGYLLVEPDGYYYATGARDLLSGNPSPNPRAAEDRGLSRLAALVVRSTGLPLDEVFFFLPALLGSLVGLPLFLFLSQRGRWGEGLAAGALAATAWGFYYRSCPGFFTPEAGNVVLALLVSLLVARSLEREGSLSPVLLFLVVAAERLWYPPSLILLGGIFGVALLLLLATARRHPPAWLALSLFAVALPAIPFVLKGGGALLLLLAHRRWPRGAAAWIPVALAGGALSGHFAPFVHAVRMYVARGSSDAGAFHFLSAIETVDEAAPASWRALGESLVGPPFFLLFAALAGFFLLAWKRPTAWLFLPGLAVGAASLFAGLRFALYAAPPVSIGLACLAGALAGRVGNRHLGRLLFGIVIGSALLSNLTFALRFRLAPFLGLAEARALEELRHVGGAQDHVVAFWEMGYPVWYHAGKRTLTDGGRNQYDNFATSLVLTAESDRLAANAARLFHERYEATIGFRPDRAERSVVEELLLEEKKKGISPARFLERLATPAAAVPQATRDLYLFLSSRMLPQLAAIRAFSNRDLETGRPIAPSVYQCHPIRGVDGDRIRFGDEGAEIDLSRRVFTLGRKTASIGSLWLSRSSDPDPAPPTLLPPGPGDLPPFPLHVVVLEARGRVLLMDDRMLRSLFVRIFVFDDWDRTLFEPVVENGEVRILRIRR